MFEENVLISFLRKFDQHPFIVDYRGREYQIGEGIPVFRVKFNQNIPLSELTTSTSIALGEAYMDKKLEIDGDLFQALDHFLGQMGKCPEKAAAHIGFPEKPGAGGLQPLRYRQ